jgi:hypothetical protein
VANGFKQSLSFTPDLEGITREKSKKQSEASSNEYIAKVIEIAEKKVTNSLSNLGYRHNLDR